MLYILPVIFSAPGHSDASCQIPWPLDNSGGNYELLGGFWPGGPLYIVEFGDFAKFAEHWLEYGRGLSGDFDGDGDVDL